MKPISEIKLTVTCLVCGHENEFTDGQWRKPCKCGTMLTKQREFGVVKENTPACFICYDEGLVFYKSQEGSFVYDFVAKCTCRAGEVRVENYPKVNEVDNIANLRWLEMKNRQEWEKRTGKKADAALLDNSQVIEVQPDEIPF